MIATDAHRCIIFEQVHSKLQEASQEMKKVPKGREHRSMMGKISGAQSSVSREQVSKSFRPTIAAGDLHPPKMRISKCDLILVGFSHGCVCLWMKIKEPWPLLNRLSWNVDSECAASFRKIPLDDLFGAQLWPAVCLWHLLFACSNATI